MGYASGHGSYAALTGGGAHLPVARGRRGFKLYSPRLQQICIPGIGLPDS